MTQPLTGVQQYTAPQSALPQAARSQLAMAQPATVQPATAQTMMAQPIGGRPGVDSKVRVKATGQTGIIIQDDRDDRPFKLRFDNGDTSGFMAVEELENLGTSNSRSHSYVGGGLSTTRASARAGSKWQCAHCT